MARNVLTPDAMEKLITEDLARLSAAQLEQLLDAVTTRMLRTHALLQPVPPARGSREGVQ